MTNTKQPAPRVDYLKFILPLDYDRAQAEVTPFIAMVKAMEYVELPRVDIKLTVLSPTESSNMRSRYVIEAWGDTAHRIVQMVPNWWWERLARVDARFELATTQPEALRAFINRNIMQRNSKKNVTTFDTKPRQKTNTRDVGGHGIVFGSRKSDIHTAIYVRGDETPAVEVRFQNRKADHIGNLALFEVETSENGLTIQDALLSNLTVEAMTELYKISGALSIAALEQAMFNDLRHSKKLQAASDWLEMDEERTWWESLSPEEQAQWQADGFVPTEMLKPKTRS